MNGTTSSNYDHSNNYQNNNIVDGNTVTALQQLVSSLHHPPQQQQQQQEQLHHRISNPDGGIASAINQLDPQQQILAWVALLQTAQHQRQVQQQHPDLGIMDVSLPFTGRQRQFHHQQQLQNGVSIAGLMNSNTNASSAAYSSTSSTSLSSSGSPRMNHHHHGPSLSVGSGCGVFDNHEHDHQKQKQKIDPAEDFFQNSMKALRQQYANRGSKIIACRARGMPDNHNKNVRINKCIISRRKEYYVSFL
jgi:hypothetical protein